MLRFIISHEASGIVVKCAIAHMLASITVPHEYTNPHEVGASKLVHKISKFINYANLCKFISFI